eukprot:15230257-Alexandrium_andersonii.AAC.1
MPEGSRRQLPGSRCATPLLDDRTARRQPKAHKPAGGVANSSTAQRPEGNRRQPHMAPERTQSPKAMRTECCTEARSS